MNQVALRAISPVISLAVNRSMNGLHGAGLQDPESQRLIQEYQSKISEIERKAFSEGRQLSQEEVSQIKILEDSIKSLQNLPGKGIGPVYSALCTVSFAASVYHGYKRNNSVGWAIWWGIMGGLFPVITPVIAYAQGFGKERSEEKK